jgi:hypothetical protein
MILEQGRPVNCADRLPKEVRVYDLLDKLNISYHRIDHEEANTMEVCQALEATLGAEICKNVLLCIPDQNKHGGQEMRQYAYYCLATPKGRMIAGKADYTGKVPLWCPLGDGVLHD